MTDLRPLPLAIAVGLLGVTSLLSGCASTSLYLTAGAKPSSDDYVFLAPYFIKVENQLTVILAQSQSGKSDAVGQTQQQTYTATLTLTPLPKKRAYAFVRRDTWFNTSANLVTSGQGLLSNSDTSSTQQIGAILTELAQTATSLGDNFVQEKAPGHGLEATGDKQEEKEKDPCLAHLKALTTGLPYMKTVALSSANGRQPITPKDLDGTQIDLIVTGVDDTSLYPVDENKEDGPGLVAYLPSPASAELRCTFKNGFKSIASPAALTLYLARIRLDPQRDFYRSPQDTLTFSNGFLVGHKYVDQSPAKTVVDTITAPIRALFPSVSVTQSTQIQTGGGKPDQTTNTTTTTTGPPKS